MIFSISFLLSLVSCHPLNRGFEFRGEYEAPRSRYHIETISAGNIKGGHDVSNEAFSIVRVCPLSGATGKSFDLALLSTPEGGIKVNSRDVDVASSEWNWKTSKGIFKTMLARAGFQGVVEEELIGSVKVLEGALAGPKGAILEGQIDTMKVLGTKSKYLAIPKKGQPDLVWLQTVSLKDCTEAGAQPTAAPDAPRR